MTEAQEKTAKNTYEMFRRHCFKLQTDVNRHDGVAAFLIAKALMKITLGLKYYQAESWALNWLAKQ